MNDKELLLWLDKARLGDESAFELVYQATHQDVYRTVAFLVYNKQDIEDIVNEIYMRMWRSFPKYDPNRRSAFGCTGSRSVLSKIGEERPGGEFASLNETAR
ncbi:hypothetical protein J2TS6_00530 [Paenibacillus albilobatus]|uniref:RNA polymerase sigma-70 region 2 domain-containing protein n=1 Tax=Paenibacillus albilobatus TaxID=2716884 RepID=A0A919XDK3_9BACL|nr:hypothetical protein J2TS6_00530 [Paenibacillus albilobatus]